MFGAGAETRRPPRAAGVLVALLFAARAPSPASPEAPEGVPRPIDLVETAESRLIQIEVTALGPPDVVAHLERDDFRVRINLTKIKDFDVDRHCAADAADGPARAQPPVYLLYFSQPHLTPAGRLRAIDLARAIVPLLVRDGGRVTILSEARALAVVHELSGDAAALDTALAHLENDRTQWDLSSTEEERQVGRIVDALNDNRDLHLAVSLARSFQREETWRAERSLRRLALSLVRLRDLQGPKVAIYFADTLRANAGEHYLSFFGNTQRQARPELREMGLDSVAAGLPFDRLINEATAQGIRFYPVLARGLAVPLDEENVGGAALSRTSAVPASSRTRFRDAEETLRSLAQETGGQAFLSGDSGRRIAERIREDLACTYVISFPGTGLAEDAPLRAIVESNRRGVTLRAPGRIVIQSESAHLTARLLAAFAVDRPEDAAADLRASLTPTGFRRRAYSALLQVAVPPTPLPSSSWSVGVSVLARDKVIEEASGRLSADGPDMRLVLEREIQLPPGPVEIVAVAHEERTGFILSQHLRLDWPDPDARPLTYGPIALFQPAEGAFLRAGDTHRAGSLCRTGGDAVAADRPVALLGLVCRSRKFKGALRVERQLRGGQEVPFPDLDLDLGDERCAQVRDLIPAGILAPGAYRYIVRVVQDGLLRQEASHEFHAVASDAGTAPAEDGG